jgi:hypothetical protein
LLHLVLLVVHAEGACLLGIEVLRPRHHLSLPIPHLVAYNLLHQTVVVNVGSISSGEF